MTDHDSSGDNEVDLARELARAISPAHDLEGVTRPLLELLSRTTGLESTYLTVVHWDEFKQEILFSHNAGDIEVPEGLLIEWADTLCRRSLQDGRLVTDNVEAAWGADHAAQDLGLVTYASVPVTAGGDGIYGTLCAASTADRALREEDVQLMQLFARLISDQVMRERAVGVERARANAAEERTKSRGMLLAAAEHKIKTPLTIVRGAAATLQERWTELDDSLRRELVDALVRGGDDLAACVDMMLAQAQAEAGVTEVHLRGVWLKPKLEAAADDFAPVSSAHPLRVSCRDGILCIADPIALGQVLGHLIENAIKYTPDGSEIELVGDFEDNAVVVTVADSGPGLPEGDLFEPFRRGDNAPGTKGTGLGLYVVKTLVTGMGGTIEASNAPTGGAQFRITLRAG